MIWLWILIIIFVLLLLVLFSSIRVKVTYNKINDHDEGELVIYALGKLIKYRRSLTEIDWTNQGIKLDTEKESDEEEELITKEKIERLKDFTEIMIHQIDHFYRIIKRFAGHMTCEKLSWQTAIGTGEAADTGWITGVIWGLKSTFTSIVSPFIRWEQPPELHVEPYFSQAVFQIHFESIIRFRIGHAILAINRVLIQIVKKRGDKAWKNTQFKA